MKAYTLVIVSFVCLLSCSLLGQNAKEVFKKVSPSIVLIEHVEGHGSGVVISEDGEILTNYHVVNVPLPLTITADVKEGDKIFSKIFRNVKVQKIHPKYDLAILKVDLPENSKLLKIKKSSSIEDIGSDCFVIGNPGGGEEVLRNTITTGIISSNQRKYNELKYIQTTAAINPGNSGGALVNKNSELVGIITFIISETEGIGFAIPLTNFQIDDFILEYDKEQDEVKSKKSIKIGDEWMLRYDSLKNEEDRNYALGLALFAYRTALNDMNRSSDLYLKVAKLYEKLDKPELAFYYFAKVCEFTSYTNEDQLDAVVRNGKKAKLSADAREIYYKLLDLDKDLSIKGWLAVQMAKITNDEGSFHDSAYYAAWGLAYGYSLDPNDIRIAKDILKKSIDGLEKNESNHINSKSSGFSINDLSKFKSGELVKYKQTKNGPSQSKDKESSNAEDQNTYAEKRIKKIPSDVTNAIPAYGGKYWLLEFSSLNKIGVYDVLKNSIIKYITLPKGGALYTAGGKGIVIYDKSQKLFHLYNVKNLKKTGTKLSRVQGNIDVIEMGIFNDRKVFLSWTEGNEALDRRLYGVLDLSTMKVTPFKVRNSGRFRNNHTRNNVQVRINSDFTKFTTWCTSHSPSGFTLGNIYDDEVELKYEHRGLGALRFVKDPSKILTVSNRSGLYTASGKKLRAYSGLTYPIQGSDTVISVNGKEIYLIDIHSDTPIRSFDLPIELKYESWTKTKFTSDRFVFGSKYTNRICILDNDELKIINLPIHTSGNKQGLKDQLNGVNAGKKWERKLVYPEGTVLIVEDAPEGVNLDNTTNTLSWNVPANQEKGSVVILLSVKEPNKEEIYERISIRVN